MKYIAILIAILAFSCSSDPTSMNQEDWTINADFIRDGCFSGKDCIPSIDLPNYSNIGGSNLDFLDDNDLVVGLWNGSNAIAYPHPILDWHEVVNENNYSISYCPLTGSAIHFETDQEFGVSGMLFNSNLIMYDRKSDSYWPQMLLKSAAGARQNESLNMLPLLETTWGTWKKLFPNSKVLNSNTGHSRNYAAFPYGSYRTCSSNSCGDYIYYAIEFDDDRLLAKERVLTIIDDSKTVAFPIQSYSNPIIIQQTVSGNKYSAIISGKDNIAIAFRTTKNLSIAELNVASGNIIIEDKSSGFQWNLLGQPLSSTPRTEVLAAANSYIAYWFSVAAFYPDTEIIQ